MKKFITHIPLQIKGDLRKCLYEPAGNEKLAYGKETSFPIIPVINAYAEQGEEIEVIALMSDDEGAKHNLDALKAEEFIASMSDDKVVKRNLKALKAELDELSAEKQIKYNLVTLVLPDDDTLDTHLKTFEKLIDHIKDNDDLFACITYGTKPAPMMTLMALRYARRLCSNVSIGCVVYGEMKLNADRSVKSTTIYDNTALVLLDDVMNALADAHVSDPAAALHRIIGM